MPYVQKTIILFFIIFLLSVAGATITHAATPKQLADKGDAGAQYLMGKHYIDGTLGKPDYKAAEHWFRLCAGQGYPMGIFGLAWIMDRRAQSVEDEIQIAGLLQKAADKGVPGARFMLADYLLKGRADLEKDVDTAVNLLTKAAGQGYLDADVMLVRLSHDRQCDARTGKKALERIKSEAQKGNGFARYQMAKLYEKGLGVPQSNDMAAHFYLQAAKWGDADAQYFLGKMYQQGLIPQRPVEQPADVSWHAKKTWKAGGFDHYWSQYWFKKAAGQGHEQAAKEIDRENTGRGWAFLCLGIFTIPFSIAGFLFPQILAPGRSPFAAKYIGAPLCFLLGIYFLADGIRALFFS